MNMKKILISALLILGALCLSAQTVANKRIDDGGSGPFKALAVSDASLPDFTIYRPEKLLESAGTDGTLPIIIFGNGGCVNTSVGHERFLNDLASYGYVAVAIGPFQPGSDPHPMPASRTSTESYLMYRVGLDCNQARDQKSEYYSIVNVNQVAAMGMSAAAQAVLSSDPRVKTLVMLNSGMGTMTMRTAAQCPGRPLPDCLHHWRRRGCRFKNADIDYGDPKRPIAEVNLPVGHGGTYGTFSASSPHDLCLARLRLEGRNEGERLFKNHDLTGFDGWTIRSKNFD